MQAGFFPRRSVPVENAFPRRRVDQFLARKEDRTGLFLIFGFYRLKEFSYFCPDFTPSHPVLQPARFTLALAFFCGTFYISQGYSPPSF
jgi:hypothetical protein